MVFVVGTISVNGVSTGFRLLDLATVETEDVSKAALFTSIVQGKRNVANIVVDKRTKSMRIINSNPLGVIDQKKLGDSSNENIIENITVLLAEVVQDDTQDVVGYLIATTEAAFAIYTPEEIVDMYADANFKYAGVRVVDGKLDLKMEQPLPVLQYSEVSEYMEYDSNNGISEDTVVSNTSQDIEFSNDDFEDTMSIIDDLEEITDEEGAFEDTHTDTHVKEDLLDEIVDFDDSSITNVLEAVDIDSDFEDTEEILLEREDANSDFTETSEDSFEDSADLDELDILETEEFDNVVAENVSDVDVTGAAEILKDEDSVQLPANIAVEEPDVFISETEDTDVLDDLESTAKNSEVTLQANATENESDAIEQFTLDETVTEDLQVLSANIIADSYDDITNKWKITCNSNGELTTAVFDAQDMDMLSAWLRIPGVSCENNVLKRVKNAETLVESTEIVFVNVPQSVKQIESHVFAYCIGLEQVVFNCDMEMPESAFIGCTKLHTITVKGSTHMVGDFAFADCVNLQTCEIKDLTKVGNCAFMNCKMLDASNIVSSAEINEIGHMAFVNTLTKKVYLQGAVKNVGAMAFAGNKQLEQVVLNKQIVMQWSSVVKQLLQEKLYDEDYVKQNNLHTFKGCTKLSSINFVVKDIVRLAKPYLCDTALDT